MELQFYRPGEAPFADSISCDNAHWCAALTIDSLECTMNFAICDPSWTEPVDFGFIQTNGRCSHRAQLITRVRTARQLKPLQLLGVRLAARPRQQ